MTGRHSYRLFVAVAVLAASLLGSCVEKQDAKEFYIDDISLLPTKAGSSLDSYDLAPDGSTYTVLLYNTLNNISIFSFNKSGYYQYRDDGDPSTVDYLHACELTEKGEYIADNPEWGLNRVNSSASYDIAFVSPGIKANSDGSVTFYPNAGDDEGRLMAAGIIRKTLGSYNIIKTDSLLFDRRCKIKYRVFLGRELRDETLQVNSITLRGAGECAPTTPVKYYPQTRQSKADTNLVKVSAAAEFTKGGLIHKTDELMPAGEGIDPELVGLPYCELEEPFYVGSGIYAPLDSTARILKTTMSEDMYLKGLDYLRIAVNVDQGSRTGIEQVIVLNNTFKELKPQHEYIINVVVASTYIRVFLDVYNADNNLWQITSGELDKEVVGEYPSHWTHPIGTFTITNDSTNDWERLNINDEIGSAPSTE